jgi:hypothetical protein
MNPITMAGNGQTIKKWKQIACILSLAVLGLPLTSAAIESGIYRILSVTDSLKVILISDVSAKTAPKKQSAGAPPPGHYVLDASAAKITVNGKPAEFKDLKYYASAQIKFELRKQTKEGLEIDGKATEIKIIVPETPKPE